MADDRVIVTDADVLAGAAHLAAVCPVWARALPELGPLPLRRRAGGFWAMADIIISQQLSVSSAAAISRRIADAGITTPDAFLAAPDDDLRALGLSRPKVRYVKGIAAAGIDWDALPRMADDDVADLLIALPGVGRWTVDIYQMFALGRPDILAPGDLALQEGARMLYGLDARPTPAALEELAAPWRPWRSVAARALWAYYAQNKGRQGIR